MDGPAVLSGGEGGEMITGCIWGEVGRVEISGCGGPPRSGRMSLELVESWRDSVAVGGVSGTLGVSSWVSLILGDF